MVKKSKSLENKHLVEKLTKNLEKLDSEISLKSKDLEKLTQNLNRIVAKIENIRGSEYLQQKNKTTQLQKDVEKLATEILKSKN